MTKTRKAPWFVNVGNVLTMTLLRVGIKLVFRREDEHPTDEKGDR